MRFSKGVIGFEYLPVSIFNLWLLILNLVKDSGLQRLFKIFDNNTGIHNMLKYKHNTFKRKIKVYTKAFYKNKWGADILKNIIS
jgi:hypothetical protein